MKKVLTLVLALMLSVCLAVPAFAVGSMSEGVKPPAGLTVNPNEEVPAAAAAKVEESDAVLVQTLADAGVTVASDEKANLVYLQDLTGEPGTYQFTVAGVGANDKVYVLHWENGAWKKVGEATGTATVTATFTSLSPVAIVIVSAPSTVTTPSTSAPTAPQTGESMAVPFIGFAVIALAGIVAWKARKQEM